jgi:hypothetical protein
MAVVRKTKRVARKRLVTKKKHLNRNNKTRKYRNVQRGGGGWRKKIFGEKPLIPKGAKIGLPYPKFAVHMKKKARELTPFTVTGAEGVRVKQPSFLYRLFRGQQPTTQKQYGTNESHTRLMSYLQPQKNQMEQLASKPGGIVITNPLFQVSHADKAEILRHSKI